MYHKKLKERIKKITGKDLYEFQLAEIAYAVAEDERNRLSLSLLKESIFFQ